MRGILGAYAFFFGAVIASFLNVVIWRLPRGESIVSPPSHCPKCGASIRWYQNVPILSWIALRGRCARCKAPISPRYILIETLGGCLFLAIYLRFGLSLITPVLWVWTAFAIAGSFIDFDHKLLPDFATVGGMILGLAYHAVTSVLLFCGPTPRSPLGLFDYPIVRSVLGLALGFGLLWLVRHLGSKAFRREAMGMGDVLLMGAIGALFGPTAVLFALIASSLLGSVVGLSMVALSKVKLGRFAEIPFGPYLYAASFVWLFWGDAVVRWYLRFGVAS